MKHTFDLTAMLQLGKGWRLGGAMEAASGLPYTRAIECLKDSPSQPCEALIADLPQCQPDPFSESCKWALPGRVEEPGGLLSPNFQSFDLLVSWDRQFSGWGLGFFMQVHNIFNRDNHSYYAGSQRSCLSDYGQSVPNRIRERFGDNECLNNDIFHEGVLPIPLIGLRITF